MMWRRWTLLGLSLAGYAWVAHWLFVMLVVLAVVVLLVDQLGNTLAATVVGVLLFVVGFVVAKPLAAFGVTAWGYSVFAFSGISYLVEQHRARRAHSLRSRYSALDALLYLFFFPKMLAGPIVRPDELIPQFSAVWRCSGAAFYRAFKITLFALFLKFFVADNLVFDVGLYKSLHGVNQLVASLVWGVRFYIDFYAYSLLAVGVAMACGLRLPYNFNSPYTARTFSDLWRRWNITLSAWLRDYVYIPLGGNRCGQWRTYLNVTLTFVVSGLWHGLNLPFLLWGLCHALLTCFEKMLGLQRLNQRSGMWRLAYSCFVVLTTILLWTLFSVNNLDDIVAIGITLAEPCGLSSESFWLLLTSFLVVCVVENSRFKSLIFVTVTTRRGIILEVALLILLLLAFVLIPVSYSFNFFYLNF